MFLPTHFLKAVSLPPTSLFLILSDGRRTCRWHWTPSGEATIYFAFAHSERFQTLSCIHGISTGEEVHSRHALLFPLLLRVPGDIKSHAVRSKGHVGQWFAGLFYRAVNSGLKACRPEKLYTKEILLHYGEKFKLLWDTSKCYTVQVRSNALLKGELRDLWLS